MERKSVRSLNVSFVTSLFVMLLFGAAVSCGPSKAEREEAARQDSIRIADSKALTEIEARVAALEEAISQIRKENSDDVDVKPLTQYLLVEARNGGVGFRDNIATQLKNIGFNVSTYKRPSQLDEMESYLSLRATRQGNGGITKIEMQSGGEDPTCTIDFANQAEADKFVESMLAAKYVKDGNIYSHPANSLGKIYAKVNGKQVKIISPFEMLPSDF